MTKVTKDEPDSKGLESKSKERMTGKKKKKKQAAYRR